MTHFGRIGTLAAAQDVFASRCEHDQIVVRISGDLPPFVIVTLSGIRAGNQGLRFPRKTRDQMLRNNAFWSTATV